MHDRCSVAGRACACVIHNAHFPQEPLAQQQSFTMESFSMLIGISLSKKIFVMTMSDVSCILSEKQNQETFTDGNNNNQNRKT